MVWGSFSASEPGELHFIEGIINQAMYLNILKENLRLYKEKIDIRERFAFLLGQ